MPADFRTALIEQSIIADITDEEVFGVLSGPAQSTYQQFQATTQSASSVVFSIQIPSENIVIDRNVHVQSTIGVRLTLAASVPVPTGAGGATEYVQIIGEGAQGFGAINPKTGTVNPTVAMQWGVDTCVQSFPFNALLSTAQLTINNVSTSTNVQDILPSVLRMNDKRKLSRWNSETPAYPDSQYGVNAQGYNTLTNNNPNASILQNGYDDDFCPRGAFPITNFNVIHLVNGASPGGAANSSLVCSTTNGVAPNPIAPGAGDTWIVTFQILVTEPFLALSPFTSTDPLNKAGLVGVNNLSMVLNIDSQCKRLISASTVVVNDNNLKAITSPITGVSLGYTGTESGTAQAVNPFTGTKLLFNFLSLQPEQYQKISTKNIVPYLDYPRYLTINNQQTAIGAYGADGSTAYTITSQAIQLNQIPDLLIITARYPMSSQNWNYANAFLTFENISVNFNNQSGLLASATSQDIYQMSVRNGSAQSWLEWSGQVQYSALAVNRNIYGTTSAELAGVPYQLPSSGSMIVLNPSLDFSLPSYLTASSLGQYQLQFNLRVRNQFPYAFTPELCVIAVNSGLFVTETGASQIFTGILTKEQTLQTKAQNPVAHLDTYEYQRLVGGKMGNMGMGSLHKMMKHYKKMHKGEETGGVSAGSRGGVTAGAMHHHGKMKKYT
jgi:hypothetical protein